MENLPAVDVREKRKYSDVMSKAFKSGRHPVFRNGLLFILMGDPTMVLLMDQVLEQAPRATLTPPESAAADNKLYVYELSHSFQYPKSYLLLLYRPIWHITVIVISTVPCGVSSYVHTTIF